MGRMDMPDTLRAATLLAFDYGLRRTGVAVGQTVTNSARALTTLSAIDGEPDWRTIEHLIDEWHPDVLLVGLPVSGDGSETAQCDAARYFATQLTQFGPPVQLIDEHLTSDEASRRLKHERQSGVRKRRVSKGDVDAVSAVVIAEQWLSQRDVQQLS